MANIDISKFRAVVEELEQNISEEHCCISECLSQYHSEVALYGDAGCGQHPSLIDYSHVKSLEAKLKGLMDTAGGRALTAIRKAEYDAYFENDDNIPF